jgi:hypothetical protein
LLTENLIDISALTVPHHTPSQPLLYFFTTPYNHEEATNAPFSPIDSVSTDNKSKSNILSRLRSNTAYKSFDKLDKTPPRKSWARQKDRLPLLPSPPSFLSRLASRLSPARTFNATPVGRLTTTFPQYLESVKRMGNPVDEQILRFYLDVKESPTSLFPSLTSKLPFLILSLRTFKERRLDLESTELSVWKQLHKLFYCIHAQKFDKPKPIDITRALYSIQTSLLSFVGIQSAQNEPSLSKKSKSFIPELTEIFEKFGRQFLTTIPGQYLSLQDLLDYVPREGELFLGFQPRRDILDRDENGEWTLNHPNRWNHRLASR